MVAFGKQQRSSTVDPFRQRLKEFAMPVGDLQQLPCALIVICLQAKSSFYLEDRPSQFHRLLFHLKPLQKFAPLLEFLVFTREVADADEIKRIAVNKEQFPRPGSGIVEEPRKCLVGKKVLRT